MLITHMRIHNISVFFLLIRLEKGITFTEGVTKKKTVKASNTTEEKLEISKALSCSVFLIIFFNACIINFFYSFMFAVISSFIIRKNC